MCVECCCWADTERCPQLKRPSSNEASLLRDGCGGKPCSRLPCGDRDHSLGQGGGGHSGEVVCKSVTHTLECGHQ